MSLDVTSAASLLEDAARARRARAPLTAEWPELDLETAYRVQDLAVARRLAAGEALVGAKLGFASRPQQQGGGPATPLFGQITDGMVLRAGEPVPAGELVQPRVAPEIVFLLGEDLAGPGVTAPRALAAVRFVLAGAEVTDSRYEGDRLAAADVVADNLSAVRVVFGPVVRRPDELDLSTEACLVAVGGRVVASATGAAVLGHPAQALALLANEYARRGRVLKAGWLVLTGAMTDAVPLSRATSVSVRFANLGSLALSCA